jgi:hypothetical protein
MDPLAVVFIPGGLTAAALLLGVPIAAASHLIWRRRARRRVARHACGHCGQEFRVEGDQFLVTGIRICEPCALAFRRRLGILLPLISIATAFFAITSTTAFVISVRHSGPELAWWLHGRWIPLLLPSVGIATVTAIAVMAAKLANRMTRTSSASAYSIPNSTRTVFNERGD